MNGCCGCTLTSTTVTACIFGMIESMIMLIINSVFLNAYYTLNVYNFVYNNEMILTTVVQTYNSRHTVEGLLVTAALLNSIWFIMSAVTIYANNKGKASVLKGWVGVTVVIIVTDIIFTIVLIAATVSDLIVIIEQASKASSSFDHNTKIDGLTSVSGYALLIINFGRFGLIGLIMNIFFAVYTFRRAQEIERGPNASPQMTQIYPGGTVILQGQQYPGAPIFVQQYNPGQQYPPGQQDPPAQQYSPGNDYQSK